MTIKQTGGIFGRSPTFTNADVDGSLTTNELDLKAIAASKAVTAVDVFAYDTSKDSDGGAWRKRTQHTSWYNETLNTATRGSRKEFPAVAVIVAESSQVTIYDGDDPDLPMWMVFSLGNTKFVRGAVSVSSIAMLNGIITTGSDNSNSIIDFVSDDFLFRTSSGVFTLSNYGIVNRNDGGSLVILTGTGVVNSAVNDAAMTVLPNAPIDPATGLPVPTIAVATQGGVSVIRDDGTVVDITCADASFTISTIVDFKGSQLWMNQGNGGSVDSIFVFNAIPTADTALTLNSKSGTGADADAYYKEHPSFGDLHLVGDSSLDFNNAVSQGAVGSNDGLNHIAENPDTPANGMVAYTTSTYNTGWMNGDIKGAFLSNTDDTDLVGAELVTNGTFDTDTDWTKGTGWTISGGVATHTGTSFSNITPTNIGLVSGKTYVVTLTATGLGSRYVYYDGGSKFLNFVGDGEHVGTFVAGSSTNIYIGTSGDGYTIDNISVRLADEDRSVNGNGLQVFGTVTRTAVATGADLVAYSGFSASNYLEQPYNSDLDFGTGDFCVMGWYKTSDTTAANEILFARVDSGNAAAINALITSSETLTLQTRESSTSSTTTTTETAPTGVWNYFAFVRRASGTVQEIYINGKLSISGTVTARNMSSSTGKVYLGYTPELASYAQGSMALWRISATAPTAEAIAKIYNDEKALFQEGAQATLFGASDAVTALAHDSDTGILSVGTSAGRSDFQGLRRVNNTTTGVTTSISASNGLIVEQ